MNSGKYPDRSIAVALVLMVALAGCHGRASVSDNDETASITIGNAGADANGAAAKQSVSIAIPGFSAKVNVPDLDLGSHNTQIEDMKIFPGTRLNGANIAANAGGDDEHGSGRVTMSFTAPGSAQDVIGWYKDQAGRNGWTVVPPSAGNQFEATRRTHDHETHFALQVAPAPGGSSGQFVVTGEE